MACTLHLRPCHSGEERWPGCTGPLGRVCALKMMKLSCVCVLAASVLAGCHQDPMGVSTVSANGMATGTGMATVSWQAPTTNTDGAALTDLSGYRIYYGISATDMSQTVQLTGVGL